MHIRLLGHGCKMFQVLLKKLLACTILLHADDPILAYRMPSQVIDQANLAQIRRLSSFMTNCFLAVRLTVGLSFLLLFIIDF